MTKEELLKRLEQLSFGWTDYEPSEDGLDYEAGMDTGYFNAAFDLDELILEARRDDKNSDLGK